MQMRVPVRPTPALRYACVCVCGVCVVCVCVCVLCVVCVCGVCVCVVCVCGVCVCVCVVCVCVCVVCVCVCMYMHINQAQQTTPFNYTNDSHKIANIAPM